MDFALVYILQRLFYRFFDFFHHWYVDASRIFFNYFISFLERLDRIFAVSITLRYFFVPLYKDYTIVGRILGVFFRSGRILAGVVVYLFVGAIFLAFELVWFLAPVLVVINAFRIS